MTDANYDDSRRKACSRRLAPAVILATALVAPIEAIRAAAPVLTGRWGDTRVPAQLVSDYASKTTRGLVVVTFSTRCPHARRMAPLLNQLREKYENDGVDFVALFPNGIDDLHSISQYALDTELTLPVFQDDRDDPWSLQLGMKVTPEVVLLDTRHGVDVRNVVYRGQINGQWFGGGTADTRQTYLDDAIESFLSGETPALRETAASGCPIAPQAPTDLSRFEGVTYYQDIARLLQSRCSACHREGELGAQLFSPLDSYEVVAAMSEVILSRIENRLMPPWHATTDPANGLGGFKNDVRLSDDQIDMFRAWVAAGCPAGNSADAPPKLPLADADAWRIGKPDFVFQMPEPYVVPRFRLDEYQYYRIRANFPEDRYIQAIELRPGNSAVVHHIGAILGPSSLQSLSATQAMLKLYGLTGDKVRKIGDYVAGDPFNARKYPDGFALKLPAGHDIFFEMHYTPTGKEEEPDLSQLGIIWAESKPEHVVETKVFNRKDLRIGPHNGHYEKASYYQFATDVLIYALAPHMHFRGKDFQLFKVENPGSSEERRTLVLKIPAYDFNWQRTYEFAKPLALKAGDALFSVAHFDNSHFNPNNPDPEAQIRFGIKSEQEMLNLRVKYESTDFGDVQ